MATPEDDIEAWVRALAGRGSEPETREIALLRTLVISRQGRLPELSEPLADATDAGWESLRARWLAMETAVGREVPEVGARLGVRKWLSALAAVLALATVGRFVWQGLTADEFSIAMGTEVVMRGAAEAQIIHVPSLGAATAKAVEIEAACRRAGIAVRVVSMRDRARLEAMMLPPVLKAHPELTARLRAAGIAMPAEHGRLIVDWVAP